MPDHITPPPPPDPRRPMIDTTRGEKRPPYRPKGPRGDDIAAYGVSAAIVLFGGVLLFACCGGFVTPRPASDSDQSDGADSWAARRAAETLVRRHLKHPLDSTFRRSEATRSGDTEWSVVGHVTTRNDFGADLTYAYVVVMHERDAGRFAPYIVRIGDDVVYADQEVVAAAESLGY